MYVACTTQFSGHTIRDVHAWLIDASGGCCGQVGRGRHNPDILLEVNLDIKNKTTHWMQGIGAPLQLHAVHDPVEML